MQRMKLLSFLLVLVLVSVTSYAADEQAESTRQKEQYEKTMEARFATLGRQLDELKAKSAHMAAETRKDLNHYLIDAEKKQHAASRELETMRKQSVKTWKHFTSATDAAVDEFEKAYEKAKAHFKD